jgi:hypothetical protein
MQNDLILKSIQSLFWPSEYAILLPINLINTDQIFPFLIFDYLSTENCYKENSSKNIFWFSAAYNLLND